MPISVINNGEKSDPELENWLGILSSKSPNWNLLSVHFIVIYEVEFRWNIHYLWSILFMPYTQIMIITIGKSRGLPSNIVACGQKPWCKWIRMDTERTPFPKLYWKELCWQWDEKKGCVVIWWPLVAHTHTHYHARSVKYKTTVRRHSKFPKRYHIPYSIASVCTYAVDFIESREKLIKLFDVCAVDVDKPNDRRSHGKSSNIFHYSSIHELSV